MASINWGSSSLTFAGAQRVYVRQRWADEWSLQPAIWCEEATWSLLPSMPAASFILKYGRVLPHGSSSWVTQSKLAIAGYFIKVEIDCQDGTVTWIGFIDQIADEQGGITGGIASGTQRFVAVSMAQVLAYEFMTRSKWYDEPNTELRWSGGAIAFNANGKPNRTESDSPEGADSHLFAPSAPLNWTNDEPFTKAKFWSSRDIANYLINYAVPTDANDEKLIKFRLENAAAIPDWDRPTIETEGKSVLSIFQELANPSKLLQLSVVVDEETDPDTVVLRVHSLTGTALSLPDSKTHPANTDTLSVVTWAAHDTNVTVQGSVSSIVNQVVVRGAKRETMFTGVITTGGSEAFLPGWNEALQDDYNAGASAETGYSAASTSEKRQMNQIVRGRHRLNDVFKTFVLNPNWGFINSALEFVFQDDEDTSRYYPWWNEINVAPILPLKEGVQYDETGVTTDDHEATVEHRSPYVVFKRPGSSPATYLQAEKMADGQDPKFSCSIGIAKDNAGLTIDVSGQHQHAIAYNIFDPLPVDQSDGEWTYIDAKLTVSCSEDRFVEYAFPASDELPAFSDAIRKKIFYAGDGYKKIRVLSDAVVDIDNDGSLKEIDASNLTDSYLVNHESKLEAIGKIAASWYLVPRQILRLTSARPSATAFVGQLLTTLNPGTAHAATINTIVSEIRIATPLESQLNPVQFSLVTAQGELDPLQFLPPPPVIKKAKI